MRWKLDLCVVYNFVLQEVVYITNCIEQSPSEANRSLASQEITRILWNSKVHYLIHNSPLPVHIQSLINAVHVSLISLSEDPF